MGKQLYTRTTIADASQVKSGVFDIARIPAAALERMVTVADEGTRYALTTATVQNGDTVYQIDTDKMYRVVDDTKLDEAAGYQVYSGAPYWKNIQDNPVTVTATKTLTVTESATLDEAVALSDKATLDTDVSFTSVDLGGDIETTALEYVIAEAKDASDNVVAKIAIEFDNLGAGTQNGVMRFYVQRAGTLTNVLELDGGV